MAGSERLKKTQAEGERLSEAQHINSSLLELGSELNCFIQSNQLTNGRNPVFDNLTEPANFIVDVAKQHDVY